MLVDNDKIIEAKEKFGTKATEEIKEYFNIQNWNEKDLKGSCPFHNSDNTPSFIWNPKNQSFHCFGCGKNYGIIDLFIERDNLTFLGAVEKLFVETGINYRFSEKGVKRNRDYHYPPHIQNEDRSKVEEYAALRKISKETLDYCDVQQDEQGHLIWNFYDENDVLLTVKVRPARKIKKSEGNKEWYLGDYDNTAILFNMNKIDPTQTLVITEGQWDTLAIIEAGYRNVVSVPGGTQNLKWIENCFDWLEQFNKIILWGDNDGPGIEMRKNVCSRLGIYRTFFVDLPQTLMGRDGNEYAVKDANDVLIRCGPEKVLEFLQNAQEIPVVGVENLADVADFDLETAPGLYTGLKDLDKIVYKFLFGSVVLVTGVKGSGKSTLLDQIFVCEALDQGYDTFLYSGELSASILKSWIECTMCGIEHQKMKNDFVRVIEPDARKSMREWYNERIWIYNESNNTADYILEKAITLTRRRGVKIWVLDNLMTIDIGTNDTNTLQKQKEFLVKLVRMAQQYNVLIVLVTHPRKVIQGAELTSDDIAGAGEIGNLAQYIMAVRRYTEKEKEGESNGKGGYKRGKAPVDHDVAVRILKNRYTGKTGDANLYFSYESYRFYGYDRELLKRYKWNKSTEPLPELPKQKRNVPDFMYEEGEYGD